MPVGWFDVIVNVVEVNVVQITAPLRQWALQKGAVGVQPELGHPFRFALHPGDLFDDVFIQPLTRLEDVVLGDAEAIFVIVEIDIKCSSHSFLS